MIANRSLLWWATELTAIAALYGFLKLAVVVCALISPGAYPE